MKSNKTLQRYDRNIIIKDISQKGQEKLLNSNVLICGAGGLGSTVISSLAAAGIGKIGIVDDDNIELSNLNRQFIHSPEHINESKVKSAQFWVNKFSPKTEVKTYKTRLNENNYQKIVEDYDYIVDCFDNFESKFLLNKIAIKESKPLIHGGITEFCGQVMTIIPRKTACLNCILEEEKIKQSKGSLAPCVSLIASIQSVETIKTILNIGKKLENKLLSVDSLSMEFKTLSLKRNPNCKTCSS